MKNELTAQEKRRMKKYPNTETFIWYNANPKHKITGDCTIRAIAKATEKDYYEVFDEMCEMAKKIGDMPDCDKTIEKYLQQECFFKRKQPRHEDNTKYTATEFAIEHTKGTYVLRLANHLVACVDGKLYDIWNCGKKSVGNYWEK